MADADTRTLNFTTPFSMEARTPECRAFSAPGLRERFGVNPKVPLVKRPNSEVSQGDAPQLSKSARRNAAKKAKLAKALANAAAQLPSQRPPMALEDRRDTRRGQEKPRERARARKATEIRRPSLGAFARVRSRTSRWSAMRITRADRASSSAARWSTFAGSATPQITRARTAATSRTEATMRRRFSIRSRRR